MDIKEWDAWYNNLKVGDEAMFCLYGDSWRKTRVVKVNKKSIITEGKVKWIDGTRSVNHIRVTRLYPVNNDVKFI